MKYLYVALSLLACALSGFAGLTAGINLNPDATVRFVPNWGSIGDWVAGVGTMLAVGVALWQTYLLRKDDAENLMLTHRLGSARLMVAIVSRGKLPVRVISVAAYSAKLDKHLTIKKYIFAEGYELLPQTLGYAEELTLISNPEMLTELAINIVSNFGDMEDLEIAVHTTLNRFTSPFSEEEKEKLRLAALS